MKYKGQYCMIWGFVAQETQVVETQAINVCKDSLNIFEVEVHAVIEESR